MELGTVTSNEVAGTTYKTVNLKVSGNVFSFTQVVGKFNYISIQKCTNNPFKTLGKQFDRWEDAESHYKSPDMQIAILFASENLSN